MTNGHFFSIPTCRRFTVKLRVFGIIGNLWFGGLFTSTSICILTRVLWGTPHGNGSKLLLWS